MLDKNIEKNGFQLKTNEISFFMKKKIAAALKIPEIAAKWRKPGIFDAEIIFVDFKIQPHGSGSKSSKN